MPGMQERHRSMERGGLHRWRNLQKFQNRRLLLLRDLHEKKRAWALVSNAQKGIKRGVHVVGFTARAWNGKCQGGLWATGNLDG